MTSAMQFDPSMTSQLACPACHGDLYSTESHLVCATCSRAYPVIDGIPVLIPDRAEPSSHPGQ